MQKNLFNQFLQNLAEKWHIGQERNDLDFGGNLDHFILGMVGGINIILWTIASYPGTPVSQ